MKKLKLLFIALAALSVGLLLGQMPDLSGTWQGTLSAGGRDLRIVMKISKDDKAALKATMYSIDQGGQPIAATAVTLQGTNVKITVPAIGGTYEGKLGNTDATAITGTWTQGPNPLPLNLTLANDKTAWTIPEPPPPPVRMAADANPSFEVATIKPSVPDSPGKGIRVSGPGGSGPPFFTLNTTLSDLVTFAYGLHPRQITNAPAWFDSEKYDLAAKFDRPGIPSDKQLKSMLQNLLAERFKLTFHHDRKELSVFAITVGKTGSKLTPDTTNTSGLPGLFFRGLGNLSVTNATMVDFANLMQSSVLDRPVVDQTALTGRFDFTLQWTPDDSQFNGRGGQAPPPANGGSAPPDLFTAMQGLGLKMEATKAPVDVLVIDHVEKPSDN